MQASSGRRQSQVAPYVAWAVVVVLVLLFLCPDLRTSAVYLIGVLLGLAAHLCAARQREDAKQPYEDKDPPAYQPQPQPPPYDAVTEPSAWATYPGAVESLGVVEGKRDPATDDISDYDYTHGFVDRTDDQAYADAAGVGGDGTEYAPPLTGYPRAVARLATPPGGWPVAACASGRCGTEYSPGTGCGACSAAGTCIPSQGMQDGPRSRRAGHSVVDKSIATAAGPRTIENLDMLPGCRSPGGNGNYPSPSGRPWRPRQDTLMGARDESNDAAIDVDEMNTYQVRSRDYGTRATEGMAQRAAFLDPYIREELDEEEHTNWTVDYQV